MNKKVIAELNTTDDDKFHKNFGITSAKDTIRLASSMFGKEIIPLPISSTVTIHYSQSKIFKRQAVQLIRFCLKNGITKNKNIIQFLKENSVELKGRTFDRYKNLAEKELKNDLDADIWLSDKVQNALVHDYKDISDRYDRQLVLDDMLMQSLITQAVDKAMKFDNDPDKFYRYLDSNEMMKIQAISNYTMKNKSGINFKRIHGLQDKATY